jgi:hypothetical protein
MTEPALPGDQLLALVSHLNSRRDGILEKWRTAVKDDSALSNASTLSSAQFYDHIPSVLDSFERNLCARNQADAVEAAEAQKELAADHGLHRWHHGYNQQEVMREWGHLHLCLVTELEFVPSLPVVPRLQIEPVALGHAEVMRENAAPFEMIDEVLNHYRQTLRHGEQIVCRFLIDVFLVKRHIKLRADFSARSFGDIEYWVNS